MGRIARMLGLDSSALEHVQEEVLRRDVEPLEGTRMSLWDSIIPNWWAENMGDLTTGVFPSSPYLSDRVWVANRCIQMNSQQIAAMPLRYEGNYEPAWCANPDPNWFPNGISDVIFAIVADIYGWGFSCLYVTDTYATGYPRTWMPLPSNRMFISRGPDGQRVYSFGGDEIDPGRVIQIDRNPSAWNLHGTPALRAYAQQAYGLLAAGNQALSVSQGGIPVAVLKSDKPLKEAQAQKLQAKWMEATQRRNGAPAVLDPGLAFEALSFNPQELGLLEMQDFDAKAIATAYGVPAVLLNMAIRWGMTYQNPAALGEMWWRFELRPTAKRLADAFTAQMLPAGQWVWFDALDTVLPLSTPAGPLAPSGEDTQAEATAQDSQQQEPAVAGASPAQGNGTGNLTVIGGGT